MSHDKRTYAEKLKDPRWQKLRLKVLERDGWRCTHCDDAATTLHVHHKLYLRGREPWDYDPSLLCTLCEPCHAIETESGRPCLERLLSALAARDCHGTALEALAEGIEGLPKDVDLVNLFYALRCFGKEIAPALIDAFEDYGPWRESQSLHLRWFGSDGKAVS
jgi:hypothetical protein